MQSKQVEQEIRSDLEIIRDQLHNQPRNSLLLEMIISTNATIPEILSLKVSDMKSLNTGDSLPSHIFSGSGTIPVLTPEIKHSFDELMKECDPTESDFLFKSSKGNRQLSITSVSRLVRKWLESSGLGHYKGVRELRTSLELNGTTPNACVPETTPRKNKTPFSLPRIETRTRQEVVFQELEKAIISGNIPPGQKLATEEIAQRMGVSRIPVREAMGRLEARGFITTRPKWGSIVNELSRENLKEILELRLLLECEAIARAVPQTRKEAVKKLKQLNKKYAAARADNDADLLLKVNRKFHMLAYGESRAPILLELINQLWDRVSPYYNIMFRQSLAPHPTVGIDNHTQLINAIDIGDVEKAKYWIKADLTRSAEFVLELFDLHQKKGL